PPIQIGHGGAGRTNHEGSYTGVSVVRALGMCVAASGCAKGEQGRAVPPVAANRQSGLSDKAHAGAPSVEALDARMHVVHEPERVRVSVELPTIETRPSMNTGAHQPLPESFVVPFAFRRVDGCIITMARIKLLKQMADNGRLVLLHQVPRRHI